MFMANRTKDVGSIYFAVRHVVIADLIFTTPAVIIQFLTGLALIEIAGHEYNDFWLVCAYVLYIYL